MASAPSDTLKNIVLTALTDVDRETFIRQVTDYAIDCDRQFDDEWQATVAGLRMFGDALRWYTDLDDSVMESWKILKKALVRECNARSNDNPSLIGVPPDAHLPTFVPTPAAAPKPPMPSVPSRYTTRVGHIRVVISEPMCSGYLSSDLRDGCVCVTAETTKALVFEFSTKFDYPLLCILNHHLDEAVLGIHWDETLSTTNAWGRLAIISTTGQQRTSSWEQGTGHFVDTAFMMLHSFTIVVADPTADPFAGHPLDTYLSKSTRQISYFVSCPESGPAAAYRRDIPKDMCSVQLVFEPLFMDEFDEHPPSSEKRSISDVRIGTQATSPPPHKGKGHRNKASRKGNPRR